MSEAVQEGIGYGTGVRAWAAGVSTRTRWSIVAAVVLAIGLVAAFRVHRSGQAQYFTTRLDRGEIRDVVDATGTVNAVKTVQVGSQVSGQIAKLNVDFNSRVHVGDVIALIDPALFRAALQQAEADLASAKANLTSAEASLAKAQATLVQARDDYDRNAPLVRQDYVTQQTLVAAKANYDVATATVGEAQAAIAVARAQVDLKAAAVTVARTNLDYTVIRSPVEGIVVARNVDVGQTVAASLQAPTIFTIAQDLTKMQLYAKADESEVGRIKVGKAVTFKVDAFPKDVFRGVVSQIRMNSTTVQNVVTYDAIIDFQNPDLKLFPGMTAYVTIPVVSVENAVKVPNSALRYRPPLPPEQIRALYAKYGIDEATLAGGAGPGATRPGDDRARTAVTGPSATPGASGAAPGDGAAAARRGPHADEAVVWKRRSDGAIEPVRIALGITDHAFTELAGVITGDLRLGDEVVTGSFIASTSGPGGSGARR